MRGRPITPEEAREAALAVTTWGSVSAAARALRLTRAALQRRLRRAEAMGLADLGEHAPEVATPLPRGPGVTRYILTAAQSNTAPHGPTWDNLLAFADHYRARVLVARVRYNHHAQALAGEKDDRPAERGLWYADAFADHFADHRLELAPGLVWAGDMNILPTAVDPLSGLDAFGGAASVIFPHPRVALRSVPSGPGQPAKHLATTGAATRPHYIKRKAGLKAEFHHGLGAALVEVDEAGTWWMRHLLATSDAGVICDLDARAEGGVVSTGHRVAVLTPGDLHGRNADRAAVAGTWGQGGLADRVRPRHQVLHDVLDFESRSHHNHALDALRLHATRREAVEEELRATAAVIAATLREDCTTWVAAANHDEHLDRWVREADWRRDPVNAAFLLDAAREAVAAVTQGRPAQLAPWALRRAGVPASVRFLAREDRLELAGVRHDLHGDIGPNGARGSGRNLARLADKVVIGHAHTAGIVGGAYQVGTFSRLDLPYVRGPSSWSHTAALTYDTGKRTLVTLRGGRYGADAPAPDQEALACLD